METYSIHGFPHLIFYRNQEEGKARKLSSLSTFYGYYYKNEQIQTNPTALVEVPKIKEKNIDRDILRDQIF